MKGSHMAMIGIGIAVAIAVGVTAAVNSMDDDAATPADESAMMPEELPALSGEISVGSLLPLTGDLATHGEENMEGTRLGVADFNEYLAGKGAGWSIRLVEEDSQTNPVVALEKLTALNARGVSIVIGPETSSNIRNIKGYSDENNMLLLSCCSTAPNLAIEGDSVYRLAPDDTNQGAALATLADESGIEAIVPIWRGDAWGDGLRDATRDSFSAKGGEVVDGVRYNPEAPEFSAAVSLLNDRVMDAVDEYGADKVAVMNIGFAEGLQVVQGATTYDALGEVRWFGSDGNAKDSRLIDDPIASEFAGSVQFMALQVSAATNEKFQHVESTITDLLGRSPNTYTHSSYDAAWIVGLSIEEAGSAEVDDVAAVLPGIASEYVGAMGDIELNAAGDLAQADYTIWGVVDGEWAVVGSYSQADDAVTMAMADDAAMDGGEMPALSGEISVGSLLPLTGDLATHGEENMEGTRLGVADFNEYLAGKGAGWSIRLVEEDSQTNPVVALEKLTALNARGVSIVIGPETSSNIRNIKGYSDENNMLLLSCCSTAPNLAIEGDSVYRLAPDDTNQGAALATLAAESGIDAIVPIWRGDAWGDGLRDATRDSFAAKGGTVMDGVRYNPEAPEFSAAVSLLNDRVMDAVDEYGAESVAVMNIGFAEGLQVVQAATQYDALGEVRWFGSDGNAKDSRLIDDPIASEFAGSVQFMALQVSAATNEKFQHVESTITDLLGRSPNTYTHASYDAAWIVGLSIEEAGSAAVDDVAAVLPGIASEYVGAMGDIELNAAGDLAQADYTIWGVVDGEWAVVGSYSQADDAVTMADADAAMSASSDLSGEVSVGSLLPLTGDLATHGEENMEGTRLGVANFNEYLAGKGADWSIRLVEEDSQTNPVVALEKLTALNARGVSIVIGPETSSNIRNIKGYSDENNMLLLSCCSTAPNLAIEGDSVYRLAPDDTNQGAALATLAAESGIDAIVPIWRGDAWGDGLRDATRDSFAAKGGTVMDGVRYNPEAPEFSAAVSLLNDRVMDAVDEYGAESVAVMNIGFAEGLQVVQAATQYDALGEVRWFGSDGNAKDSRLIDDPIASEFAGSVQFMALQVSAATNEKFQHVESTITDLLGRSPNTYTHASYDAAWIVGLSIEEAGSAAVDDVAAVLPGIASEYVGAMGDIELNAAGDLAQADYTIWGVVDGEWAVVGSYSQADDAVTLDA